MMKLYAIERRGRRAFETSEHDGDCEVMFVLRPDDAAQVVIEDLERRAKGVSLINDRDYNVDLLDRLYEERDEVLAWLAETRSGDEPSCARFGDFTIISGDMTFRERGAHCGRWLRGCVTRYAEIRRHMEEEAA